jgi:hypothetical protein
VVRLAGLELEVRETEWLPLLAQVRRILQPGGRVELVVETPTWDVLQVPDMRRRYKTLLPEDVSMLRQYERCFMDTLAAHGYARDPRATAAAALERVFGRAIHPMQDFTAELVYRMQTPEELAAKRARPQPRTADDLEPTHVLFPMGFVVRERIAGVEFALHDPAGPDVVPDQRVLRMYASKWPSCVGEDKTQHDILQLHDRRSGSSSRHDERLPGLHQLYLE